MRVAYGPDAARHGVSETATQLLVRRYGAVFDIADNPIEAVEIRIIIVVATVLAHCIEMFLGEAFVNGTFFIGEHAWRKDVVFLFLFRDGCVALRDGLIRGFQFDAANCESAEGRKVSELFGIGVVSADVVFVHYDGSVVSATNDATERLAIDVDNAPHRWRIIRGRGMRGQRRVAIGHIFVAVCRDGTYSPLVARISSKDSFESFGNFSF